MLNCPITYQDLQIEHFGEYCKLFTDNPLKYGRKFLLYFALTLFLMKVRHETLLLFVCVDEHFAACRL